MLMFDIETLGVESTSIVLSAAIIYFNPEEPVTYDGLIESSMMVKFDAMEQRNAHRVTDQGTVDWWKKQAKLPQRASLLPSEFDVSMVDGIKLLRQYIENTPEGFNQIIWARGSLDQLCIESMCRQVDQPAIMQFSFWRDVRTAIDIMYGSKTGYVKVSSDTFDESKVVKHHPVHDCALDIMMILYGVEKR